MQTDHLNTYQELMARFQVSWKTVYRWFRGRRRFKPTPGTVRIPEQEVLRFIQESQEASHGKK